MTSSSKYIGSLSPEYALLGLLAEKPAHGYDLHQRLLTDLGHVWHISQSQVYNILTRLEQQKLIKGTTQAQSKLPARRIFRLTAAGQRRFDAWFGASSGSSVRAIRVEFLTRLYLAQSRGSDIAQHLIAAQLRETQAGLTRLQTMLADLPSHQTFNRLGLELRIRQLSSIMEWLVECQRRVGQEAQTLSRG